MPWASFGRLSIWRLLLVAFIKRVLTDNCFHDLVSNMNIFVLFLVSFDIILLLWIFFRIVLTVHYVRMYKTCLVTVNLHKNVWYIQQSVILAHIQHLNLVSNQLFWAFHFTSQHLKSLTDLHLHTLFKGRLSRQLSHNHLNITVHFITCWWVICINFCCNLYRCL